MKKLIVLICFILLGGIMYAQGQVFIKNDTVTVERVILTKYKYVAPDGNVYPIYISKNGKCFIVRKSQKTGKEWCQYLPQVTEKLEEIKNKK